MLLKHPGFIFSQFSYAVADRRGAKESAEGITLFEAFDLFLNIQNTNFPKERKIAGSVATCYFPSVKSDTKTIHKKAKRVLKHLRDGFKNRTGSHLFLQYMQNQVRKVYRKPMILLAGDGSRRERTLRQSSVPPRH